MKLKFKLLFIAVVFSAGLGSYAQTRTEKDLLGEKQIPADAYYGVQTARALENFQVSGVATNFYPDYVRAYAMVKMAAARANHDVGRLPKEKLDAVIDMLPAITSPTVSPLHNPNWYSLEIIINESQARSLMPELLKAGARGIIEYPLKKVLDG